MASLEALLQKSAENHQHLCPRQVLGVRIGLAGAAALGLELPRHDKRLCIFIETDGCFADGVGAATGCSIGHRTLRLMDHGKIAATFVDVKTETALRVAPRLDVRERARRYAPEETRHYFAQLTGYQRMPEAELLLIRPVQLTTPIARLVGRAGVRVNCGECGEEIINGREMRQDAWVLCQACAGMGYYMALNPALSSPPPPEADTTPSPPLLD